MEFKVRPRKLKYSSQDLRGSSRAIGSVVNKIESAIGRLDIGDSTGRIKSSLRKTSSDLSFLAAATSGMERSLQAIGTEYERTEAAIKNQRKVKNNSDLFRNTTVAACSVGTSISELYKAGKNAYNTYVGDPVNLDNGNFIYENTDLEIGGDEAFAFSRIYNSLSEEGGTFGKGWMHNYEMKLREGDAGITVLWEDGRTILFKQGREGYESISGSGAELFKENDGFKLINAEGTYHFSGGLLSRVENENGSGCSLIYNGEQLSEIRKDTGEWFRLDYKKSDQTKLISVTDHTGRAVRYSYKEGLLSAVTRGNQETVYEYDPLGRLDGVIAPSGVRILHNEYDAENRVVRQMFPDGSVMSYSYDDENYSTVLREKNGSESYHYHDEFSRNTENVYTDGTESYEYNEKNQITLERDRNGNETKYQYDNRGNVTKVTMASGAVVNITYERHNKPATVSVNGERRHKYIYDDNGNLLEYSDALGRRTIFKYNEKGLPAVIKMPGGEQTELTYDDRNNVIRAADSHGGVYGYEYDALNRVTKAIDSRNNTTLFSYDMHGNLTSVTDAAGNTRTFKFNRLNKITEAVDFNGAKTVFEYNNLGFPSKVTDPLGHISVLEYDSMWNETAEILPNGGTRRVIYDENNRPAKEIDALGNETVYEYDGNGNLISKTDAEGGVTEYGYNCMNELTFVRDAEGNETHYRYDASGNLVYTRDPNGAETNYEYDAAGQLVKEILADGQTREYSYTPDGDIALVQDEAGRLLKIEYRSKGKPGRIAYPDGREEIFEYDGNGNVVSRADKQGLVVRYSYDALDRLVEAQGSDGGRYTYTYDEVGNLTSAADTYGNTSCYQYDLNGNLTGVIDELGNRTEYEYDELDLLTKIKRISGSDTHITEYSRDLCGNIIKSTDPLGFIETFEYNGNGAIIRKTDKDGFVTDYAYDLNGRINAIRYNDGKEVMMSYDALGKLAEVRDWSGSIKAESDLLGRITRLTYPDSRFSEYTYGKAGERTGIRYPDGRFVSYGYNEALKLTSLKEGATDIRYTYDGAGRLVSKSFAGGLSAKYEYDVKGQLTGLTSTKDGKILDSVKIGYDLNGNRISAKRFRDGLPDESGLFEYGYDAAGKLTSVSKDGKLLRRYDYDAFGNRTALTDDMGRTDYRYDAMDRLLEVSGARNESFRYDRRGNVIERRAEGEPVRSYVYGAMNRLESAAGGQYSVSYEYNGLGHRIEERVRQADRGERVISYVLDMTKNFNNLLERNIGGEAEAYIWDGIPLALKGSRSYEYVCDDKGSPSRLLGMDGSNAGLYGYDEFGVSLYEGDDIQPFRYTGYRKDPVADMYFAQAREYMPEHGRFAAQDWVRGHTAVPGSINAYLFCCDMPFRYVDPDGRFVITAILATAAIGAGVGAIVGGGWELGSQLVGQVTTGDHHIHLDQLNGGKILTSAFGGAITGGFTAVGHPVVGASLGGFAEGSINAALDGKNFGQAMGAGLIDGAVSGLFAWGGELFKTTKLADKMKKSFLKNNRVSKYFKNFGSHYKGQLTRAMNAAAKGKFIHLGWRTFRNGLVSETWSKFTGRGKSKVKSTIKGLLKCWLV